MSPDQVSKAVIRFCLAVSFREAVADGISPRPPIEAFITMKDGLEPRLKGDDALKFWASLDSKFIIYEKISRLTLDTHAISLSGLTGAIFLSPKNTIVLNRQNKMEEVPYSKAEFISLLETRGYGVQIIDSRSHRIAEIKRLNIRSLDNIN